MRDDGGREERCAKGGEEEGSCPPPPVQTVVALICSISTITGSASSLVVIRVIFTRTEEPRELQRAKKKKNWKVRKAFCCDTKIHKDHKEDDERTLEFQKDSKEMELTGNNILSPYIKVR